MPRVLSLGGEICWTNYGLRDVPSIWLIGPNGRVLAKDLRGEVIKTAVAAALAR